MSFLLDSDICSAYLKNNPKVVSKVMRHFGGLHVSMITVGELLTWARRANASPAILRLAARKKSVEDIAAALEVDAEMVRQVLAQAERD